MATTRAQSTYITFSRVNALSFASLADAVVILYALKLGADDAFVALISSFLFLSMPFMMLGKYSVARRGAVKTLTLGWILRNCCALGLFFAPIAQKHVSVTFGFFLFGTAAFAFASFRSFGITSITPIIGDITSKENRGQFIAKNWFQANLFFLIAMLVIIFFTNRFPSVHTFQTIIVFGAVTGITAGFIVSKVPESDKPSRSAEEPVKSALHYIFYTPNSRKLLFAWMALTGGLLLTIPFSLLAIKNGYGITDDVALVFSGMLLVGGISASYANTLILDRVGPRPMMILYGVVLMSISLFWIFAPRHFVWPLMLLPFFLAGTCNAGINTTLSHYLLSTIPADRTVSISMMMKIISGAFAGLCGSVLGSGILRILNNSAVQGLWIYKLYFSIIFCYFILVVIVIKKLEPVEDRRVKDVLGIMFSFREWRALYTLQKISESETEEEDQKIISKLGRIGSDISEESLAAFLDSPRFLTRARAIRALGQIDYGRSTVEKLLDEVKKEEFTTAYLASEVLGEHRNYEAIPVLRQALHSKDVFLVGKTMLALAQLEDKASYKHIETLFSSSKNPRIIIYGAQALVLAGGLKALPLFLHKLTDTDFLSVQEELLYCITEVCGAADLFYKYYPMYKSDFPKMLKSLRADMEGQMEKHEFGIVLNYLNGGDEISLSQINYENNCLQTIEEYIQSCPQLNSIKNFRFSVALLLLSDNSKP